VQQCTRQRSSSLIDAVEDSELLVEPLHSHKAKFVDDLRQSVSSLVEHLHK